ncbi:hypothetical protein Ocin01_09978 [Orchesella cincta]|uniref:Transmembrane protein n=1 Tax=Orchesella cincta TaxID=48709 RepID=A0A1D2MVK0_ORCCI|nr:hypothetical protein Ocin01_09978 [Orchesella cincta]
MDLNVSNETEYRMTCCPTSNGACALVIITIWIELCCGLVATTWTAFFNGKGVDEWAFVIFFVHLLFSVGVCGYTGHEIYYRLKKPAPITSVVVNWVFVVCTFVTTGLFAILCSYNHNLVGESLLGSNAIEDALVVYVGAVVLLILFYISALHSYPEAEFHIIILSIWLQLGSLLAVNIRVYILFTTNLVAVKRVCGLCVLITLVLFGSVFYYNTVVLNQHILELHKIFWVPPAAYIFALLLFCLLLRRRNESPTRTKDLSSGIEDQEMQAIVRVEETEKTETDLDEMDK